MTIVQRVWIALSTIIAAIAIFVGLSRPVVIDPLTKAPVGGPMPECQHSWRNHTDTIALTAFLGSIRDVAEFHDCQRLIEPDKSYGALAAVFARPRLDTVSFTPTPPVVGPPSPLPIVGGSGVPAPVVTSLTAGSLVVLGLVYLPYGGEYDPFDLEHPLSCIVISPQLQAWLVREDEKALEPCSRTFTAEDLAASPSLEARVSHVSQVGGRDVPPVARWDFDTVNSQQYIGIRCGTSWCEIGAKDFVTSEGYAGPPTKPSDKRFAVKGWYDEQYLAHFPETGITPGPDLGTVVPTEDLEGWTDLSQADGEWMRAAEVYMRPSAGPYEATMNFIGSTRALPDAPTATISLCRGTAETCLPFSRLARFRSSACGLTESTVAMFGAIQREGQATRYVCVKYRHHGTAAIVPAVVRWRWRPDDETIWIRCPEGCCEIQVD